MATLKRSDITSSEEDLGEYYAQLRSQHITPAWIGGGITLEAAAKAVPYVGHWRDLRPRAMGAAQLVGTRAAEPRGLRLSNPPLTGIVRDALLAHNPRE